MMKTLIYFTLPLAAAPEHIMNQVMEEKKIPSGPLQMASRTKARGQYNIAHTKISVITAAGRD